MDETKYLLILVASCAAIIFFVMLLYITISISKRKNLETENKLRLIEKEKQVELLTAIAKAEDFQKIKLASHLHDIILPIATNASSRSGEIISKIEKQGIDLQNLKNELKAFPLIQDSIRQVIHEIVPELFTSFGLLKAIEVYLRDMNKGASSIAEFRNKIKFSGEPPFSINDQLVIFKICREIINNLQKHSNYEYLNVSLEEVKENFTLLFSHDGIGITNELIKEYRESTTNMGLKLIESRVLLLNAEINYTQDADASYVRLKIPIKK